MRHVVAVFLAGAAALCAAAPAAQALPPTKWTEGGMWVHKHAPKPITLNDSSLPLVWQAQVADAALQWNVAAFNLLGVQYWRLDRVTGPADVDLVFDNSIKNLGLNAQVVPNVYGHWTHAVVKFWSGLGSGLQAGTICHELGHVVGGGHGGNGCLGLYYTGSSGTAVPTPGTDTPNLLRSAFAAGH